MTASHAPHTCVSACAAAEHYLNMHAAGASVAWACLHSSEKLKSERGLPYSSASMPLYVLTACMTSCVAG